jgi:hypothetical protein
MTATVTNALRRLMAENWTQHTARTSYGCLMPVSAVAHLPGESDAAMTLRCVLLPFHAGDHETFLPDGPLRWPRP